MLMVGFVEITAAGDVPKQRLWQKGRSISWYVITYCTWTNWIYINTCTGISVLGSNPLLFISWLILLLPVDLNFNKWYMWFFLYRIAPSPDGSPGQWWRSSRPTFHSVPQTNPSKLRLRDRDRVVWGGPYSEGWQLHSWLHGCKSISFFCKQWIWIGYTNCVCPKFQFKMTAGRFT